MGKGIFTQGIMVLLKEAVPLEKLGAALGERPVLGTLAGDPQAGWMAPRPSLVLPLEGEGKLVVDVVDVPWPDHMGDLQKEPELFNAWTHGFMGPFTFPNALARAVAQSAGWDGAAAAAQEHKAFVRVRSSWVIGAGEAARVLPEDYDAEAELEAVTKVAHAFLTLPEALAYFDPSGEVLLPQDRVSEALELGLEHSVPPFDLWANVRLFRDGDWVVMDSVGMRQLDMDDQEVCFPAGRYQPQEIYGFIRQSTFYMLEKEISEVAGGEVSTGPGGVPWRAQREEQGLSAPPRAVLRWFPNDGSNPPPAMKGTGGTPPEPEGAS